MERNDKSMAIQDLKASLDLKQNLNIFAQCKQFDNLNLILSIYDNSLQADLTNYDVRLRAMKADNVPLIQQHIGIDIDGNVVNVQADEQLTTTAGNTPIELQFIDKSTGEKKSTFNLILVVVASAIAIEASISKATYTLLEELENKLDQLSDFFEHISEAIEANTNLENTIANSETAKTNLDGSITAANTSKTALDTSKTNADNTKNALDTLKTDADNTKNALNTVNQTGQALLNSLEEFEQEHADVTDISNKLANINEDLSEKVNFTNDNVSPIYIAPFFRSDADISVDLYATTNGIDFKLISKTPLFSQRDSSIMFRDGYFYVVCTRDSQTLYDLNIMRSKNLIDWEKFEINLGLANTNNSNVWAGEWFEDDNGKLYILLSVQVGIETVSSNSYPNMRPYLVEVLDLENRVFGAPTILNLNNEDVNRIDGFIYKKDANYYLFIKREPVGYIEIWKSLDLITWENQTHSIPSLANEAWEAPSVTKIGDLFYLYVDNCDGQSGGNIQYCTSPDLINFSAPSKLITQNTTRHGTVYKVTNRDAKLILNDYINANSLNAVVDGYDFNILDHVANTTLTLINKHNTSYYALGTVNLIIDTILNRNVNSFFVTLKCPPNQPSTIIFKNSSTIVTPGDTDFIISTANGFSEVAVMFIREADKYRVVSIPSPKLFMDYYNTLATPARINLDTLATNGVIDNLVLKKDTLYTLTTQNITINSASFGDDGTMVPYKVYFSIFTSPTANLSLTIKYNANSKLLTPIQQDLVMSSSVYGDIIVEFIKIHPGTSALRMNSKK